LRVNDLDNAIVAMETAASKNSTDLDNLCNLGTAHLLQKRPTEAEKAFKAICFRMIVTPQPQRVGLAAVQRGDVDTARSNFEKAIELDPKQVEPMLHWGALQDKGDRQQALQILHPVYRESPS